MAVPSFFPFYTTYFKYISIAYILNEGSLTFFGKLPARTCQWAHTAPWSTWGGALCQGRVSRSWTQRASPWPSASKRVIGLLGPGPAVEQVPGGGLRRSCPSLLQPGAGKPKSSHAVSPPASVLLAANSRPAVPLPSSRPSPTPRPQRDRCGSTPVLRH